MTNAMDLLVGLRQADFADTLDEVEGRAERAGSVRPADYLQEMLDDS